MSLLVRDAMSEDIELGLMDCLRQLSPVCVTNATVLKDVLRQRSQCGMHTLVAEIDGRIVGTLAYFVKPCLTRNCLPSMHIEDVAVHPLHQRSGIGSELMAAALQQAKLLDCYKVVLCCGSNNVPFYMKLGFSEVGVEMRHNLGA